MSRLLRPFHATEALPVGMADSLINIDGVLGFPSSDGSTFNLIPISALQVSGLANVARSGAYTDLTGKPTLANVATTGSYTDLTNKPTLGTAAALDVGTTASKVVQLDGSAKLPALDGSQLVNLPVSRATLIRKTVDESVTNSSTAQQDDALVLPIGANETWAFEFHLRVVTADSSSFKLGLKGPTSPTSFVWGLDGPAVGVAIDGTFGYPVGSFETSFNSTGDMGIGTAMGVTSSPVHVRAHGHIVNGANAGSVSVWWSQVGPTGATVTVKAGSYILAHRIS